MAQGNATASQWLAFLLTGDAARAAELTNDAVAHAFADWGAIAAFDRARYLVCAIMRLALGAQAVERVISLGCHRERRSSRRRGEPSRENLA